MFQHKDKETMKASKTIKEMDSEFAAEAGMSYEKFTSLTIMEQSKIKRTITNNRLKNLNK